MKFVSLLYLFLLLSCPLVAQEITVPKLDPYELSPKIQSPLYQSFTVNEFDLLVKNVNVYAPSKTPTAFNFELASSYSERRGVSYQPFYDAVNRQMAQYSDFQIEIDNSKNFFMDYHQEPIYSGMNRLRNDAFIEANRTNPGFNSSTGPLLYSPSLSRRNGLIWN